MTEEEKQFNQWFDQYANGVKVFEEADMKQAYLQGRQNLNKKMQNLIAKKKETSFAIPVQMQLKDVSKMKSVALAININLGKMKMQN